MNILFVVNEINSKGDAIINLAKNLEECLSKDHKVYFVGHDTDKFKQNDFCFYYPWDEKVRKVFALLEHKFSDRLKLMKYCERTELYKKVLEDMIPDAKIGHRTFREEGKLLSCFIVPGSDDEDERYYLFNKEKRSYEEIDSEKYKKFYDDNDQVIKDATDSNREPKVDE